MGGPGRSTAVKRSTSRRATARVSSTRMIMSAFLVSSRQRLSASFVTSAGQIRPSSWGSLSNASRGRTLSSSTVSATSSDDDVQQKPYFERICSPRTVLAPMVSQSDLPFRLLCRKYGAQLSYTQMIHAKNYLLSEEFRSNHLDVYSPNCEMGLDTWSGSQMNALDGQSRRFGPRGFERYRADALAEIEAAVPDAPHPASLINPISSIQYPDEGPVVVQLAGHDPQLVSDAALDVAERTQGSLAGIDLNLGCPQTIARKGRYGAHLMEEDPKLVCQILAKMRKELPQYVGVSAKIRLPIDEAELKDRIQGLVESGVDAITVHGRNLKENKTKVKSANWDAIALAAQIAREHSNNPAFPIIANGGIEYGSDVDKCLAHTGASAVMSSESLLENPAIFATSGPYASDDADMSPRQIFARQIGLVGEYLDLATIYPPVPGSLGKVGGSFNVVRSHVFKMLYRYLEEQPDLRTKLADGKTTSIPEIRQILKEIRDRYGSLSKSEWETKKSGKAGSSWYRRHRDAAERVHRRGGSNAASLDEVVTVEDKKRMMKERIRKLKEQRERKDGGSIGQQELSQEERVAA